MMPKVTTVYLTPDEQVALRVILARRKKRLHARSSLNEIIVDGLWKMPEVEGISKEQIAELLEVERTTSEKNQKIAQFPDRNSLKS